MSRGRRKLITIDSETDPFLYGRIPAPFSWVAYDGDSYYHWTGDQVADMMTWLSSQHCVVYAHNGGRFDFQFLQDFLEPYSAIRIINGRTASFRIGRAIFRDSFLILPTKLASYKKDSIDYTLFERAARTRPGVMEKIITYQKKDCLYLYELVAGFRKQYGGSLTLASSAVRFVRKQGIEIPASPRAHYRAFRPYFHGGRVSCFRSGVLEGDFTAYDINSAYPLAMKTAKVPWGVEYEINTGKPPKHKDIGASFLDVEAQSTGAFCIQDKKGALYFPADGESRTFHVSGYEYQAALETGTLKKATILRSITFKKTITFDRYVDHFYNLKKTLDRKSAEYLYAKLFLNSFYGKLGANPEKYRSFWVLPTDDMEADERGNVVYPEKFHGCKVERVFGSEHQSTLVSRGLDEAGMRFYNVATAAAITGFVRALMWRAVCVADNPVYCDTDGLICEGARLEMGNELGQWKVEFRGKRMAVAGKKLYALTDGTPWRGWDEEGNPPKGWKVASKGVKLTGPEIFKIAAGASIDYKKDAPSMGLKSGINFVARTIRATV